MALRCTSAMGLGRRALLAPRSNASPRGRVVLPFSLFRTVKRQELLLAVPVHTAAHSARRAATTVAATSSDSRTVSAAAAVDVDVAEPVAVTPVSAPNKAEEPAPRKPGQAEDGMFQQHPSVAAWRSWYFSDADYDSTPERAAAALQRMIGSVVASSPTDPTSVAYWAYHSARNLFLALQGVASVTYTDARKALRGETGTTFSPVATGGRLVAESYECFRQDLDNIRQGVYKLPWDMTNPSHRQYNPLFVLGSSLRFLTEADKTLSRRRKSQAEPVWMESAMYPDYYMNTFHYQTDGWLSSASAAIYETSTETLFIGRQDAMQRNTLIPIHAWLSEGARDEAEVSLLEVACGTGRFHTFIKDNYPQMSTTALELSPYYLQAARQNVKYWAQLTGNTRNLSATRFVQAAAEAIPEPDNSYDVVLSVYLFHEMPRHAQEAAAAEMARVLKPGGLLVFTDSIQLGDRPVLDANIAKFEAFNEPHYPAYVNAHIGQMFVDNGLQPHLKSLSSATKTLSFRKPSP